MSSTKWRPFCLGLHVLKSVFRLPEIPEDSPGMQLKDETSTLINAEASKESPDNGIMWR